MVFDVTRGTCFAVEVNWANDKVYEKLILLMVKWIAYDPYNIRCGIVIKYLIKKRYWIKDTAISTHKIEFIIHHSMNEPFTLYYNHTKHENDIYRSLNLHKKNISIYLYRCTKIFRVVKVTTSECPVDDCRKELILSHNCDPELHNLFRLNSDGSGRPLRTD